VCPPFNFYLHLISGLLTSVGYAFREALILKEPTKNVDNLSVNSNYPKKSLDGLTLTKSLRQFHDLQRNIHRLIATTFVLGIEPIKNKKLNSEGVARNPVLLAQPPTFVLHQNLRHVSGSEFIDGKNDGK